MLARVSTQTRTRPDASLRRALYVAAFIVFWMVAICVRLVYLQVTRHDSLSAKARYQQQDALETIPQRGQVLDRNGKELARSIDTDSVFVAPDELVQETPEDTDAQIERTAAGLAPLVNQDQQSISVQLRTGIANNKRFVWIARRLPHEIGKKIQEQQLAGVHLRQEPKRFYPNGTLAAHVLGFVGLDNVGLGGVEQVYNEKITGEPGKLFLEKDSGGNAYESYEIPASAGQTIVLTIDQSVQYRAEQALYEAVKKARAKSGTAIVVDPRTGEILALANVPTFDPNNVRDSSQEARKNWALQNIYEPGSTFKIVPFAAAMEKGLARPEDRIDCQMGSITVAGRLIRDHTAFGTLTLTEALAKSSNVAAIKLGLRAGDQSMHEYMKRFGFGSRTGVELPGETAGLLRPLKNWHPSSIGSLSIGQEIGVTPLQMAAAFGAIANNGIRLSPHIVREIRTSSGASVYRAQPEQREVVSEKTATALRGMLESVTLNGTAKQAQLDGYTAAGKTGTAQKIDPKTRAYSKTKHVASFVGFAPVTNPAVVIVVVIDEPSGAYHGGDVAAPVFRSIAEQILPDLGVAPDTDFKTPAELIAEAMPAEPAPSISKTNSEGRKETRGDVEAEVSVREQNGSQIVYASAANRSILMPDLGGRSVRDVARTCAQLGLQIEAHGEGRVTRQKPSPGTEVQPGHVVYVEFARSN
ncbi:MAG TPA: penicillin-binding protein [Pyrinomonadaceae bacterium]